PLPVPELSGKGSGAGGESVGSPAVVGRGKVEAGRGFRRGRTYLDPGGGLVDRRSAEEFDDVRTYVHDLVHPEPLAVIVGEIPAVPAGGALLEGEPQSLGDVLQGGAGHDHVVETEIPGDRPGNAEVNLWVGAAALVGEEPWLGADAPGD